MSVMNEVVAGSDTPLKMLELALQRALSENGSKREANFKEAYPLIEQYLACKIPQKALLEQFNAAYRHKLHPPGFRKMLEVERKRRADDGEHATCTVCGHRLLTVENAYEGGSDDADQ